ncbi:type II toxin-antitoxin system VapC family toxin [Neorhizobium vignae]|uniref:type II toxin-antitoxin system VapC family toxin n=1 Tax=Neorhizobium vignae TaxID=690585 RepID=UPI000A8B35F1|nr:type II toxin-antitoxin system VapC family toxin [Neorhizobium vignae]
MFIDTSVIVAILAQEDDGSVWSKRMEGAERLLTSPLVILEATLVLSTRRIADPLVTQMVVSDFLRSSGVEIVPIEEADGEVAALALCDYGKGRGHPARLNQAVASLMPAPKIAARRCSTRVTTLPVRTSAETRRPASKIAVGGHGFFVTMP